MVRSCSHTAGGRRIGVLLMYGNTILRAQQGSDYIPIDPDAANYIARLEAREGALEDGVKQLMDNLFIGLKIDGVMGTVGYAGLWMGPRTIPGCMVNMLPGQPDIAQAILLSAVDYDRKTGIKGRGVETSYINTNVSLGALYGNTYQNNLAVQAFKTGAETLVGENSFFFGDGINVDGCTNMNLATSGAARCCSTANASANRVAAREDVVFGMRRSASNNFAVKWPWVQNTESTGAASSVVPTTNPMYVFARNNGANVPAAGSTVIRLGYFRYSERTEAAFILQNRLRIYKAALAGLDI